MLEKNSPMPEEEKASWSQFTQEVTMHGIRYVHLSNRRLLVRVFWLIMILLMVTYAVYACQEFFTKYDRKETNTRFKNMQVEEQEFPTVVFCGRNSFSKESVEKVMKKQNLTGLDVLLKGIFSHSMVPMPEINWSLPEYKPLFDLSSKEMINLVYDLAPSPRRVLLHNFYNYELLDTEANFPRVLTDMGLCYVFNADGKYRSTSVGMFTGLALTLDTQVDDYYIGSGAVASGYTVALYSPGEVPVIMKDGNIGVKPGSLVNIVIEKNKIKRQPPPADNNTADCYDTKTKPNYLSYYPEYTYNACYRECAANFSVEKCGCRNLFDPAVGGAEICKPDVLASCIQKTTFELMPERTRYMKEKCKCKKTCEEVYYTSQMSIYDFPNAGYLTALYNTSQEDIDNLRKNILQLDMSYRSLSYNYMEEYLAYTWMDVIANLGGTLGVCIGASLLTVCEFIQFGVDSMALWWGKRREKRITKANTIDVQPIEN